MPAVEVSPSGRSPGVQSDGTRIWIAWLDTRTSSAELHVGYRLPMGGLVSDVALTAVVPAGDEAFELVREGTTVKLAVLTQSELALFELCP